MLPMLGALVALSGLLAVRLQVCGIYYHAAFGKLQGTEWADGTAMYYWLSNPTFGATPFIGRLLRPVLGSSVLLAGLTWGTIVAELFLFMGLLATHRARRFLLWLGVTLHLGILVFMGLFSFSVTLFGALVLYLRPSSEPFDFSALWRFVQHQIWARQRNRSSRGPSVEARAAAE